MDYRVKTIVGGIEMLEAAGTVTKQADGVTYQPPSISAIKLLDNATLATMEIGATPSDCLTFTINDPNKQNYDGETVELWIAPPASDTAVMQEMSSIEDSVGSTASSEGMDTREPDELDDDDGSEGEDPTQEELAEVAAATTANIESAYTTFEGEAETIVDEQTDEAEEPEWKRVGTFFVQSQTNTDDGKLITLTCYDSMQKLNRWFIPTNRTATVQNMFDDFRAQALEELQVTIDEFDYDEDATRSITMPSPVTYREVLGWFAGLVGGFATCDDDGSIGFALYAFSDGLYLDSALNYMNVDASGELELDGIECDKGFIQEDILSSGFEADLKFKNPFMTQEILDEILETYKGIRFSGGALGMPWDASMDAGSFIRIMSAEEYRNYLQLQNALAEGGTDEEILAIKENMNALGKVLLISYQLIDFNGDATTTIASVCNSVTANENQMTSPTDAKFNRVTAKIVETEQLIALKADIEDLEAQNAMFTNAVIQTGTANDFSATKIAFDTAAGQTFTAAQITALNAAFDQAVVGTISASNISSVLGTFSSLITDDFEADEVKAATAYLQTALIQTLQVEYLKAGYARVDLANIGSAMIEDTWINRLLVQTGLLANDADIFTLDAIQVNASSITAGTIDVERLIVTYQGEKYLIHIDPTTQQPTYQKLDGGVIQDNTIAANKIVANSITTAQITTQNLVGTNGWINLAAGVFAYWNNTNGNGIVWDGSHLTIGAESITMGTVDIGQAIADAEAAVQDMQDRMDSGEFKGEDGEDALLLRVDSSRGTAFKNSEVNTVLSAVIFYGGTRIENIDALHSAVGQSAYLQWKWQGYDSDVWHTIANTDSRIGRDGFTLTLTPADVDIKAVFSCELID